jgi:hypothetical protein
MAGVITDLLDRVSDSATGRPIIANLAAPGKAIAAASINLDAATNWTTTTAIHFSIYETMTVGSTVIKNSSTQTDWKGTLSGVAIGNLTLTGGTDRAYTAGAKVEITPTSRFAKDLYDWAITGHNQNGSHKAFTESNIVPTAAIQDSAITTAKIANSAVTSAKLAPSKTTDANGWTVYDYGTWKEYKKRVTHGTYTKATNEVWSLTLSSSNLPVGMSTLGTNYIHGVASLGSNAYSMGWNFEMNTASAIINITAINNSVGTVSYSGFFDLTITQS